MQSEERRILIVAYFGHFMCHYNLLVFPALVLPLAGILKMDLAQVLQLSFLQFLLFGVSALPWGIAADRWGGRPLMILMFLGAGMSGFAAAFWIEDPVRLSLSLGALGLFSGIYHPIGMGLISKGVKRLNVAMGYNAMFGGLGLVVAARCNRDRQLGLGSQCCIPSCGSHKPSGDGPAGVLAVGPASAQGE